MSRLLSWLSTKNGRRFTHFCVGGATLAIFGNYIAIRGPALDRLVDVFQVYRYGKPRPLSDKVNVMIEEVLRDSKLKAEEKQKLKFFFVVGLDPFHAGGIDSPWGAVVGVPFTFEDDADFGELRLHGREAVDWVIEGQELMKALTLSEAGRKFALLREIYACSFSDVLLNAAIAALCFLIPARFAHTVNRQSDAFRKLRLRRRNLRYLLFYACGFLLYRLVKDPLRHLSDEKSDRLAAETGPEYLEGGIEYYEKTLLKNKALEDLSASRFWRRFDDKGNESFFLLAPRLPVSKRLDNLRAIQRDARS